jgi:hypothetical protein
VHVGAVADGSAAQVAEHGKHTLARGERGQPVGAAAGPDQLTDYVGVQRGAAGALGQQLPRFDFEEYSGAALHGQDFWLLVQRLDGGPPRVHLDLHTDDLNAEVARLERLGAARVQQVHAWWVMRDPAGLLFCVIPELRPGALHDGNAQRWE